MILHTGGLASGTISTKSKLLSRAVSSACFRLTTPSCSPSACTRRTSLARMSSLTFRRFDGLIGLTPNKNTKLYSTCFDDKLQAFLHICSQNPYRTLLLLGCLPLQNRFGDMNLFDIITTCDTPNTPQIRNCQHVI